MGRGSIPLLATQSHDWGFGLPICFLYQIVLLIVSLFAPFWERYRYWKSSKKMCSVNNYGKVFKDVHEWGHSHTFSLRLLGADFRILSECNSSAARSVCQWCHSSCPNESILTLITDLRYHHYVVEKDRRRSWAQRCCRLQPKKSSWDLKRGLLIFEELTWL